MLTTLIYSTKYLYAYTIRYYIIILTNVLIFQNTDEWKLKLVFDSYKRL